MLEILFLNNSTSILKYIVYNIENTISKWITDNLKGRFYVGKAMHITDSNSMDEALKIGFEEPKELSYFTLACPYLKYK